MIAHVYLRFDSKKGLSLIRGHVVMSSNGATAKGGHSAKYLAR
uniref:Transposase n=1 Tax=Heterorhabditis bacteriophora TaxID=37862 RepID=A0A1I7WQD4_HETBA